MWNSSEKEWLPWYRAPGYKGNLSEEEKRLLDGFRSQRKHPAASYADLPSEVQSYISGMEVELLDAKRNAVFFGVAAVTTIIGWFMYKQYTGEESGNLFGYVGGGLSIIIAWIVYRRETAKIEEHFFPTGKNAPGGTDEAIRKEWELEYLFRRDKQRRG